MPSTVIRIPPSQLGRTATSLRELGSLLADQQIQVRNAWANLDIEVQAASNLGGYVWQAEQAAFRLAQLTSGMGDQLFLVSRTFEDLDEACRRSFLALDAKYDSLRTSWLSMPLGRLIEFQRISREVAGLFENMGSSGKPKKVEKKGWRDKIAGATSDAFDGASDFTGNVVDGATDTAGDIWDHRDEAGAFLNKAAYVQAMVLDTNLMNSDSRKAKMGFAKGFAKGGWNTVKGLGTVGKWVALSAVSDEQGKKNADFLIRTFSDPGKAAGSLKNTIVTGVTTKYTAFMKADLENSAEIMGEVSFEFVPQPIKIKFIKRGGGGGKVDRGQKPPVDMDQKPAGLDVDSHDGRLFDDSQVHRPADIDVHSHDGRLFDDRQFHRPPELDQPLWGQDQLFNPIPFGRQGPGATTLQVNRYLEVLESSVQGSRAHISVAELPSNGEMSLSDIVAIVPKDTPRLVGGIPSVHRRQFSFSEISGDFPVGNTQPSAPAGVSNPTFHPSPTIEHGYKWDFLDADNRRVEIKIHSADWNMGGGITSDSNSRGGYTAQIKVAGKFLTSEGNLIERPVKPKTNSATYDADIIKFDRDMNNIHIPLQP